MVIKLHPSTTGSQTIAGDTFWWCWAAGADWFSVWYVDFSYMLWSSNLSIFLWHCMSNASSLYFHKLSFKVQHSAPYKRVDMTHVLKNCILVDIFMYMFFQINSNLLTAKILKLFLFLNTRKQAKEDKYDQFFHLTFWFLLLLLSIFLVIA